uniref:GDT1 family protein n=1 Tax=Alexandrium monilatum TaxID=311494 RepID=A0A7S4PVE4_9DINO
MLQSWFLGYAAALGIKFTSSVDDVVWLAPFLTSRDSVATRVHNSTVYIGICMVQTLVAMVIAYSGNAIVGRIASGVNSAWTTEKIMTVGAGVLLALYSLKLLREYIQELQEDNDNENEVERPTEIELAPNDEHRRTLQDSEQLIPPEADAENPPDKDSIGNKEQVSKGASKRREALYCIAFIGSIDDLTLFVPMLVGKGFDVVQLALGAFTAASSIVMLCIFIGLCKPIADFLSRVPLFLIVMGFATLLLIRGFSM